MKKVDVELNKCFAAPVGIAMLVSVVFQHGVMMDGDCNFLSGYNRQAV